MKIGYKLLVKIPAAEPGEKTEPKQVICSYFMNTHTGIEFRPLKETDIKELASYGYREYNGLIHIHSLNMDLLLSKESIFI